MEPGERVPECRRARERVQVVSSLDQSGDRPRCKVGTERHDHGIAGELPASGADGARRGIEPLDLRTHDVNPLALEPGERPLDALGLSLAYGEPEQRGLEEVLRLAVDQDDPVRVGEVLPQAIRGDQPAHATTENDDGLGLGHVNSSGLLGRETGM